MVSAMLNHRTEEYPLHHLLDIQEPEAGSMGQLSTVALYFFSLVLI